MHILIIPSEHFVVEKNPLGGIFQYEQAKALAAYGHSVGVLSVGFISLRYLFRSYPYLNRQHSEGINIYRRYRRIFNIVRFSNPAVVAEMTLKIFEKLYGEYEKLHGRPDVVHAHNFLYAGALAKFLNERIGIPFVLTEHSTAFARGLVPSSYDPALQAISDKAAVLSCVSEPFRMILENRFKKKFRILPNLVDSLFFDDRSNFSHKDSFIFINVASLEKKKNQGLLLRAFASRFRGCPIQLRIVGGGPLRAGLEDLAHELGIHDQVMFLGLLSRGAVRDEMRQANCFVLTSDFETFGVVLIEALASGLPLISTRSGGPEDIVNSGNGLLIDRGAERALSEAMHYMVKHTGKYDKETLRDEARNLFGEVAFVRNVIDLYKEVVPSLQYKNKLAVK